MLLLVSDNVCSWVSHKDTIHSKTEQVFLEAAMLLRLTAIMWVRMALNSGQIMFQKLRTIKGGHKHLDSITVHDCKFAPWEVRNFMIISVIFYHWFRSLVGGQDTHKPTIRQGTDVTRTGGIYCWTLKKKKKHMHTLTHICITHSDIPGSVYNWNMTFP